MCFNRDVKTEVSRLHLFSYLFMEMTLNEKRGDAPIICLELI